MPETTTGLAAGNLLLFWISDQQQVARYRVQQATRGLLQRIDCELATSVAQIDAMSMERAPLTLTTNDRSRSRWWFRNLERLGHIERLVDESGRWKAWRVVPPTFLKLSEDVTLACGARTPELMSGLERLAAFEQSLLQSRVSRQRNGPDVWTLAGDAEEVRNIAESKSYQWGKDRGLELLASMKRLNREHPALQSLAETSLGEDVDKIYVRNGDRFAWQKYDDSLMQIGSVVKSKAPIKYAISLDNCFYALPPESRYPAMWSSVAAAGQAFLEYKRQSLELLLPASPGLPLLAERALIMASGRLPVFKNGRLTYFNIDEARAIELAKLLAIRLVDEMGNGIHGRSS